MLQECWGNDVLRTLTSDMGPVESHEGAVVRGISSVPVKITGEFILGGLQTGFREHKELNEQLEQKATPCINSRRL